jgi:hypothetical protein
MLARNKPKSAMSSHADGNRVKSPISVTRATAITDASHVKLAEMAATFGHLFTAQPSPLPRRRTLASIYFSRGFRFRQTALHGHRKDSGFKRGAA